MVPRRRFAVTSIAIAVLTAACSYSAPCPRAFAQEPGQDAKEQLKERDRLRIESQKLRGEGKLAEAIAAAEAMLAIERKVLSADDPDLAVSLGWLAELDLDRDEFAAARTARQEALQILRKRFGEPHWKVTDARLALEDVDARASRTAEQRQRLAEAARLNSKLVALYKEGKYADATTSARDALAILKEVQGEHHPDYATNLNDLAELLRLQGDYGAARPLFERALAINKEVLGERHPDYALSLSNLALLLQSQGDYAAARPLYERALAIRKEVLGERHSAYAQSLNNLAALFESQGDYAAARPLFERASAIFREVLGERHPDYATSLNNLAFLLQWQGDYAAARPLCERALAINREVLGERHPAYALSLNNLAFLFESEGDYAAARPLYERALAINEEVLGERHPHYASGLNNLAMLLQSQGDHTAARPLLERALAIRKEVLGERHPDYAGSLNNLAFLFESEGDYAAARPLYERALAINKEVLGERHPDYARILSNLGFLLWAMSDAASAASLLKQALEITEANLDLAAAVQSERQQLAMTRSLRWNVDGYLSLSPHARILPRDTYRYLLGTKGAIFERQQRIRAQRRRHPPDSEAARRFEEYTQTVAQLAALAMGAPDPKKPEEWKARIEDLSRRKDKLESELSRLDPGFRAARAVAGRTPEQLQGALIMDMALIDFLVYTAYQPPADRKGNFQREQRVLAFVVRRDRPIARVELGPVAPIKAAVDAWRPLLVSGKADPAEMPAASTLWRLIWEPLEGQLEGASSVLISPDGPIGLVPLGALPGKEPGHYLIEERSIAIVPVPRMLGTAQSAVAPGDRHPGGATEPAPKLLLAGEINYGGDAGAGGELVARRSAATPSRSGLLADFTPLRETRLEVLAIRDSFEERFPDTPRAQVLRGDKATEEAIRQLAPKSRYLHLATHGYFAPPELRSALAPADSNVKRPGIDALSGAGVAGWHPGLLSGIALAGANVRPTPVGHDDGILTALEVAELDLSSVELAVLSACETGLGEVAGGEGLLGLQRAFQVAGAHSVIASLWKVGDEPTRALMARFYENLWRKGHPPAQALREAQLAMLKGDLGRGLRREADAPKSDRAPPFYWAAFVLSGDWR
jgi:CHAT domain-containing protein/tetratricopeptide (TPR) repeat protein